MTCGTGLCGSKRIRVYALLWTAAFLIHFSWQSFDFTIACIRHESADEQDAAVNETISANWRWLGPAFASWSLGTLAFDLPAGYLVDKFGVRVIFGTAVMMAGALNAAIPFAIHTLPLVCVVRFFCGGLTQGIRWCAQNSAAGKWVPVNELGLIMGVGSAFAAGGSMFANSLGAVLCTEPLSPGWPGLFYLSAGLMCLWACLWFIAFRERPEWDAAVPEEEADHITATRNFTATVASAPNLRPLQGRRLPWRCILSSPPLWAAGSCGFANAWLTAFTVTYGPTFFQTTTTPSLVLNGIYASLPLLGNLIVKLICGFSSDLSLRCLSRTRSMKLYTTTALASASVILGVGSFVIEEGLTSIPQGGSKRLAITILFNSTWIAGYLTILQFKSFEGARHNAAILIASFTMQGAIIAGAFKSPVLLAPRYAGVLTGVMEIMSSCGAIASLNTISHLTGEPETANWNLVFALSSAVAAAAAVAFFLFGSGETQAWNAPIFTNPKLAKAMAELAAEDEDLDCDPAVRSPGTRGPDFVRLASIEHTM